MLFLLPDSDPLPLSFVQPDLVPNRISLTSEYPKSVSVRSTCCNFTISFLSSCSPSSVWEPFACACVYLPFPVFAGYFPFPPPTDSCPLSTSGCGSWHVPQCVFVCQLSGVPHDWHVQPGFFPVPVPLPFQLMPKGFRTVFQESRATALNAGRPTMPLDC